MGMNVERQTHSLFFVLRLQYHVMNPTCSNTKTSHSLPEVHTLLKRSASHLISVAFPCNAVFCFNAKPSSLSFAIIHTSACAKALFPEIPCFFVVSTNNSCTITKVKIGTQVRVQHVSIVKHHAQETAASKHDVTSVCFSVESGIPLQ